MTTTTEKGSTVQPYLSFDGRCEEAIEFYRKAIGAEVLMLMRFKDSPQPPQGDSGCGTGASADKIMHSTLRIGNATIMASDGRCEGKPKFEGISLSLSAESEAEADKFFKALSEGGQVQMPMMKTFFSPRFGMVTDRFGVNWMVLVVQ